MTLHLHCYKTNHWAYFSLGANTLNLITGKLISCRLGMNKRNQIHTCHKRQQWHHMKPEHLSSPRALEQIPHWTPLEPKSSFYPAPTSLVYLKSLKSKSSITLITKPLELRVQCHHWMSVGHSKKMTVAIINTEQIRKVGSTTGLGRTYPSLNHLVCSITRALCVFVCFSVRPVQWQKQNRINHNIRRLTCRVSSLNQNGCSKF